MVVRLIKPVSLVVLVLLGVAALATLAFRSASPSGDVEILLPTAPPPRQVVVYVTGAVVSEGLYAMRDGDRVAEAVAFAGGLLADADRSRVDGAALLRDGDHIHVPRIDESSPPALASASQRLDLNTATEVQLEGLPGIGAVRAKAVIAYRGKIGRFSSVEQLLDVPGIGPITLATLRPLVEAR